MRGNLDWFEWYLLDYFRVFLQDKMQVFWIEFGVYFYVGSVYFVIIIDSFIVILFEVYSKNLVKNRQIEMSKNWEYMEGDYGGVGE